MADVTVEFGATDTGLSETLNGIRESMKNLETQQKTTAMSTDEVEKSLRELKKLQGMEKHFMALSGETEKLSESQMEAKRASEELAAAMKKAEEETRALAEEQKKADAITKANRTATEIYNQEIEELQKHLAAGRISMDTFATATAKADQRLSAATPQAKDLGNQIENVGDKTKKVGGIFDDEFKRMGAAFTVGNLAAEGFQKAISLAFDAARAVVRGFSDALDLGGRLSELSARTGEAAGTLLVLETAFKNSGLEASQVGQVINKLQNFMQDATNGGEKQTKVMRDLGISFADLAGKTPSDQMQVFAEKIAGIQDPTQRAATASEVFGEKLGGKLLPLLVDFSGNIDDARDKVGSLEQVMNENADTFDKFSESIEAVKGKMAAFSAGVLSETVPSLQKLGSEMEGVDAAGLGEIIGQILNPAITDLTKNITLATDIFGTLKKAASDAGSGLKGQSDQFKEGATEANKYLQVVAALLPGGLNPLGLGLKAVANVAGEATDKMNGVATAADDAKPALATLGNEAVDTGDKIAKSFTLTSDLNTDITSIGASWSNVTDEITTSNSLLEGTQDAFTALNEETDQQVFGLGNINDQVIEGEKLRKKLLEITERITDKEADAAEKSAEKLKERAQMKRDEIALQIKINNAIANGDTKLADSLKNTKELNKTIKDLSDAGLNEATKEAEKLTKELAKSAREADRVKNSLATKIGTQVEEKQKSESIDPGGRLQKKAQEQIAAGQYKAAEATGRQLADRELDTQLRGTGADRDRRSYSDIIKDYYGEKAPTGLTDKEQKELIRQARDEGQYKDTSKMTDTSKKGLDRFANLVPDEKKQEALDKAKKGMEKGVPEAQKDMTSKTGAEEGRAKGEGGKDSNSVMESIKTAVEAIKTAIEKIEPKLPTAALST